MDMGRGEERVRSMERVIWKLTLPYVKQIANRNLLYGSGNSNRALYQTRGVRWGGRWEGVSKGWEYTYTTGEGNGKPLQYSCRENPMNSMKRQKDRTLKDELPRSAGAQYATGDQWRNNSRKNETEPKQKQHAVLDVTSDGSRVQCCKEIGRAHV